MATVFETKPGFVAAVPDPFDKPIPLAIDGWTGYQGMRSIITQLGVQRQGNFQVVHSLEDLIYVYVFGDRVGQMRLAGLCFSEACALAPDRRAPAGGGSQPSNNGAIGIESLLGYYDEYSIAKRDEPVNVQLGTTDKGRFKTAVVGMNIELLRPEGRISQFAMQLLVYPRAVRRPPSGSPGQQPQ